MSALAEPPSWQSVDAYHTPESVSRAERPSEYVKRQPLLDKRSEPNPILSLLMDEALLQIVLTADGSAMALTERVSGAYADTKVPNSGLAAEIDELGGRFAGCKTHRQRLEVIKHAQATAIRLKWAPDRSLIRGTEEWKQVVAQDARSTRVLAEIWGVSHMTIARLKKSRRP